MERRNLLRRALALCLVLAAILPYTPVKAAENVVLWKSSETGSDAIYYTSLSKAITKVNESGGYVQLLQDIHISKPSGGYAIDALKGFTLDLNNYTLSCTHDILRGFFSSTSTRPDYDFDGLPDSQKVIRIKNGYLYTDVDANGNRLVKTETDTDAHTSFLVNLYRGYLQMENVRGHAVGQAISFYSPDLEDPSKDFVNLFKNCTLMSEVWYTFIFNSAGEKPSSGTHIQNNVNITVEDSTLVSLKDPIFASRLWGNTVTLQGANRFYIPRTKTWYADRSTYSTDSFSGGTARSLGMTADNVSFTMPGKYANTLGTFTGLRLFETERISGPATPTNELRKALAETAIAYYLKGTWGQYDSLALGINGNSYGSSRRTSGAAPELAARDSFFYTVCSDFMYNIYKNALDYDLMGTPNHAVTDNMTNGLHEKNPMVMKKYSADAGDDKAAFLEGLANFTFQIGDIIVEYRDGSSSGHAMMYVGDIDGDGKSDILHSGGDHYARLGESKGDGYDTVEGENYVTDHIKKGYGTVMKDTFYPYLMNPSTVNDSYNYHHLYKTAITEITILRPLKDPSCTGILTPSAKMRLSHPSMSVTRTADVTRYNSVQTGQNVTVTVTIENKSDKMKGTQSKAGTDYSALTLTEYLPAGTALVSAPGATRQGNSLVWTAAPKAGTTATFSYTVRITAPKGSRVDFPLSYLSDTDGNVMPTRSFYFRVGGEKFSSSALTTNASGSATSNAKAVDKILGKTLNLPINDIAALQTGLMNRIDVAGPSSTFYPEKQMWQLKERSEVSSAYLPLYDMLLDEHDAGFVVYSGTDPLAATVNPSLTHRVREFREMYYEPGDIFVGYYRTEAFNVKNATHLAAIKAWKGDAYVLDQPDHANYASQLTQATNYWQSHGLTPDYHNVTTFTYVYLGNGKVAELKNGAITVKNFSDTIGLSLRCSFLVVFRPSNTGAAREMVLGSVRYRDGSSLPLGAAPAGACTAEVDISNYELPLNATIALAAYDANGKFLGLRTAEAYLKRGLNTVKSFNMTGITGAASFRAFALSDTDTFAPVGTIS